MCLLDRDHPYISDCLRGQRYEDVFIHNQGQISPNPSNEQFPLLPFNRHHQVISLLREEVVYKQWVFIYYFSIALFLFASKSSATLSCPTFLSNCVNSLCRSGHQISAQESVIQNSNGPQPRKRNLVGVQTLDKLVYIFLVPFSICCNNIYCLGSVLIILLECSAPIVNKV